MGSRRGGEGKLESRDGGRGRFVGSRRRGGRVCRLWGGTGGVVLVVVVDVWGMGLP